MGFDFVSFFLVAIFLNLEHGFFCGNKWEAETNRHRSLSAVKNRGHEQTTTPAESKRHSWKPRAKLPILLEDFSYEVGIRCGETRELSEIFVFVVLVSTNHTKHACKIKKNDEDSPGHRGSTLRMHLRANVRFRCIRLHGGVMLRCLHLRRCLMLRCYTFAAAPVLQTVLCWLVFAVPLQFLWWDCV